MTLRRTLCWPPGAATQQTPLGPLENFENAERVSFASGARDTWLADLGWGVWIEWRTDNGNRAPPTSAKCI
jgi:hypothetical protein